jgi:hypothetical protein
VLIGEIPDRGLVSETAYLVHKTSLITMVALWELGGWVGVELQTTLCFFVWSGKFRAAALGWEGWCMDDLRGRDSLKLRLPDDTGGKSGRWLGGELWSLEVGNFLKVSLVGCYHHATHPGWAAAALEDRKRRDRCPQGTGSSGVLVLGEPSCGGRM